MARQVVVKGNYVLCAGDVLIGICGVAPHLGTQCGVSRLLLFVSLIASNNTCRRQQHHHSLVFKNPFSLELSEQSCTQTSDSEMFVELMKNIGRKLLWYL